MPLSKQQESMFQKLFNGLKEINTQAQIETLPEEKKTRLAEIDNEINLIDQELTKTQLPPEKQQRLSEIDNEINLIDQELQKPKGEILASGIAREATLDYLPQIQAGVEKAIEYITPKSKVDIELEKQGFKIEYKKPTYADLREKYIDRQKKLDEMDPRLMTEGKVIGALATGIGAGAIGTAKKVTTTMQRLGTAVKAGGLFGFLRNPGDTEGLVDPIQIQERIKNSAINAGLAMVFQGGIEGAGKVVAILRELPDTVKRYSELKAVKAAGAMLKDFRRMFGRKRAYGAGRRLLDEGLVQFGDDVEAIAKKLELVKAETGKEIGKIYDNYKESLINQDIFQRLSFGQKQKYKTSKLNPKQIAMDLTIEIIPKLQGKAGSTAVINKISSELDTLASNGETISIKKLNEIRQSFDDLINYNKRIDEMPIVQQQYLTIRNRLKDKIRERVRFFDDVFKGKDAKRIEELNKKFYDLADIALVSEDMVARINANRAFGLSEQISGAAGLGAGAILSDDPTSAVGFAMAAAFGSKALRKWGNAVVATTGNNIAKMLAKNPLALGEFSQPLIDAARNSPKQFVITIELLMKDPEFKKYKDKINGR